MNEPVASPKYSVFEWVGSACIVFGAICVGVGAAILIEHLLRPGFLGLQAITFCIAIAPVVWIAKRAGCLEGFSWWAFPFLGIALAICDAIIDAFQLPFIHMHLVHMVIFGGALRMAARFRLMPPLDGEE